LVADLSNFGTWSEQGALDATRRAQRVWQRTLEGFQPPASSAGAEDAIAAFVERRTREGGAPPAG
jgi:trimethylamine--corrinoid protein Co-methyltransferase